MRTFIIIDLVVCFCLCLMSVICIYVICSKGLICRTFWLLTFDQICPGVERERERERERRTHTDRERGNWPAFPCSGAYIAVWLPFSLGKMRTAAFYPRRVLADYFLPSTARRGLFKNIRRWNQLEKKNSLFFFFPSFSLFFQHRKITQRKFNHWQKNELHLNIFRKILFCHWGIEIWKKNPLRRSILKSRLDQN